MMNYVFGIDLGTTYSCIAYMDEYGKPVVLKNSDGDHTTPSVVMVESADNVVVGMEAKRSIEVDPDRTVQFIKRKMGKENDKGHAGRDHLQRSGNLRLHLKKTGKGRQRRADPDRRDLRGSGGPGRGDHLPRLLRHERAPGHQRPAGSWRA